MAKLQIITHRGLEPTKPNFYPESSIEAFKDQLSRGFGIEFDPNFVKDGIVIFHDSTLERLTNGKDKRPFTELTVEEVTSIQYGNGKKGRIPTFDELMGITRESSANIHGMHLKGKFQKREYLDRLVVVLKLYSDLLSKIIIFDVKPETARYLKSKLPNLVLAPSVAHTFDIRRYNDVVLGTLITVKEAIGYKQEGLYDWVWLDEWDLTDENGGLKILYNKEVISKLRSAGYKIALVTPELHGTSPGLLGGEAHTDAKDKKTLFKRIAEIIVLEPDALCTDYPEEVQKML